MFLAAGTPPAVTESCTSWGELVTRATFISTEDQQLAAPVADPAASEAWLSHGRSWLVYPSFFLESCNMSRISAVVWTWLILAAHPYCLLVWKPICSSQSQPIKNIEIKIPISKPVTAGLLLMASDSPKNNNRYPLILLLSWVHKGEGKGQNMKTT